MNYLSPDKKNPISIYDALNVNGIVNGYSSVSAPQQSVWLSIVVSLIPTIILVLVLYLIYRSQAKIMNGQGGGVFGDKSPAQIIKSDKKFSDVAGNKEIYRGNKWDCGLFKKS
ncbi:hypothetical protein NWP96_06860 [Mycoplasmopsis cynos]|nr:hypothetical protein [Mycoplasmopsis cynos]